MAAELILIGVIAHFTHVILVYSTITGVLRTAHVLCQNQQITRR